MEGYPAPAVRGTDHLKGISLPAEVIALLEPSVVWLAGRSDPAETKIWELVLGEAGVWPPNAGLVGIPFDTTSIFKRGSCLAPQRIREILALNRSYEPNLGIDLLGKIGLVDFGDILVVQTDVPQTHQRIEIVLRAIWNLQLTPIVLGGDHGGTYSVVKALAMARTGPFGIILFDAHTDLRRSHHGEITSGTPFRRILEEIRGCPVRPENLVEIGIGGWHNSRTYWEFTQQHRIKIITSAEVHRRGIEPVIAEAVAIAGKDTQCIFVSVDIDAVDAAYAPGTGSPTPGGLTSLQLLQALSLLGAEPRVAGMDLVEVSPPYDVNNITSHLAAALVQNFLAGLTLRKGNA